MTTRTQPPAEALASQLYGVDARVERRAYEDPDMPDTTRHAIYLALNGVRAAEEKIASAASWIRDDLDRIEQAINGGRTTYSASILRNAADHDAAVALREAHLAALSALTGEEEFTAWAAARAEVRAGFAGTKSGKTTD